MNNIQNDAIVIERNTLETQIKMKLDLSADSNKGLTGKSGIAFFDHMLNTLAIHSGMSITLQAHGDIEVDCHHTIEDVGIVFGKAIDRVVAARRPISRYGTAFIPMDEALARSVIDISGRPYLVFDYTPKAQMIGSYDTQMTEEFFRAVAFNMNATLHLAVLYAQNDHHAVEALFKSFAHALSAAIVPMNGGELSAKGTLLG